ncbi:MAG: hypothetical protein N2545_06345, partial [Thermoflexales bacterium]|nr:hypothetical protein [Thermoflexales bacterium]
MGVVSNVVGALENTLLGVTQLKRVYRQAPASVQTADLPCAVILQGAARIRQHAAGMIRQERTFVIVLAVQPIGQERWLARTDAAIAVYEAVIQALLADLTLGGVVDHIAEIADDG